MERPHGTTVDGTTVVSGRLPPGAAHAVVIDDAGDEYHATVRDGVWQAVCGEPGFSEPLVRYTDSAGALVPVPLPPGERQVVADAIDPCPVCGEVAWVELEGVCCERCGLQVGGLDGSRLLRRSTRCRRRRRRGRRRARGRQGGVGARSSRPRWRTWPSRSTPSPACGPRSAAGRATPAGQVRARRARRRPGVAARRTPVDRAMTSGPAARPAGRDARAPRLGSTDLSAAAMQDPACSRRA